MEHPDEISKFWPIALCNVLFKIVTNTVVLRLKPFINNIVSPNQSSFIPGRSTHDNILILQELAHSLANSKSKIGSMIIKLDLEKAYDNISWPFLKQTLDYFHFPSHTINLIMSCVEASELRILWNGEPLEPIHPRCGLRQGDPLSPYLFVLCMERLSYMIDEPVQRGEWIPVSVCRGGPKVSHMFFADDIILVAKTRAKCAHSIKSILDHFCLASGLKISLNKSKVFYATKNQDRNQTGNDTNSCY
ncbi:hypothetical protein BUALT_Bualt03G0177000 [Buddleja alternifolia]|uniref:Reverse transcriptase domain-containing protein n=1 Tax=Buddleja alternifolia TaxID=168488 RepID=A0AAV6Y2R9_9LAMI|nr:hypothetical protein BUALT_Bualt03G0177000 [Buddleja alternifolia]